MKHRLIRWFKRDEFYYRSLEGRFSISPGYFRGNTYPDDYIVNDHLKSAAMNFDRIGDAKDWAEDRIRESP